MTERIIIAGSGGQGIMLVGKILAQAAMIEGKFVTWLPAYGAEVRGGTAHCMIVISESEIGSPRIEKADTVIIMNQPSLTKFKSRLKNNGLLIINSSLVKTSAALKAIKHPFTDIAVELGNKKVANMIALGCLLKNKKVVAVKSILNIIKEMARAGREGLLRVNQDALERGVKLGNG